MRFSSSLAGLVLLVLFSCQPKKDHHQSAAGNDSTSTTTINDTVPPFTLQINADTTHSNLPAVQSFVFGTDTLGRWLIFGGRINGFHGFAMPNEDFPYDSANVYLMVYDPDSNTLHSFPASNLPTDLVYPFSSSNQQHWQVGDDLYVCGGYGQLSATQDTSWTHNTIAKVSVSAFTEAIVNQNDANLKSAVVYGRDTAVQVTGGELFAIGNRFYLVFGHRFNGAYSAFFSDTTIQRYTNQVRQFEITENNDSLSLSNYTTYTDPLATNYCYSQFHRRDLIVAPTLSASLQPSLTAFSGVFTCPHDGIFYHPIYIEPNGSANATVTINTSFSQPKNNYSTWNFALADTANKLTYNVLLGGIGDSATNAQGWIKDVTCVIRNLNSGGGSVQYTFPTSLSNFSGSEGDFITLANNKVLAGANGIFDLSFFPYGTAVTVGYVYGGIWSSDAAGSNTLSTNQIYEVVVTKN
ncbi:MAG: hypothetical protein ACFB10_23805 [Salibacteraceae bacterium]